MNKYGTMLVGTSLIQLIGISLWRHQLSIGALITFLFFVILVSAYQLGRFHGMKP